MRKQSLRKTSLLSLLGFKSSTSSAQSTPLSSLPAQPTDDLLTSFSPSTETLVPTPSQVSVNTLPTGDFPFTVSLAQPTGNGTTVSTPISQDVTAVQGTATRSSATESNPAVVYMGQAAPVGYRKVGFAGALIGAAGVFMV